MKVYAGRRTGYAALVTVDGSPLNPRLDLWNHSPTGFEWGYHGSGPSQLALALIADCTDDDRAAILYHQEYKDLVVARLPQRGWKLTSAGIWHALEAISIRAGYSP